MAEPAPDPDGGREPDDWRVLAAALWQRRVSAVLGLLIGVTLAGVGLLVVPASYRTTLVLAPVPSFGAYAGTALGTTDRIAGSGDYVAAPQNELPRLDRLDAFAVSTDTAAALIATAPQAVALLTEPSWLHRSLVDLDAGKRRRVGPVDRLAAYLGEDLQVERQAGVLRLSLVTRVPEAAETLLDRLGTRMDEAERAFAQRTIDRHVAYLEARAERSARDDERRAIHRNLDRLALATLAIEEPGPFAVEPLGNATTSPRPEFPPPPAVSLTAGMAAGTLAGLILPLGGRSRR